MSLSNSESSRLSDDESYIPSWVFEDDSNPECCRTNEYEYELPDEYEYDELSLCYLNNQPAIPWHKRLWKQRIYPCLYYIRWTIFMELFAFKLIIFKWTKESGCSDDSINAVYNRWCLSLWQGNPRSFKSSSRRGILIGQVFQQMMRAVENSRLVLVALQLPGPGDNDRSTVQEDVMKLSSLS